MSDLYPIGQPIRLGTTVSDITGAVTDPTSLTLTYGLRAAAVTTKHWPTPADIIRDALGTFHYDLTPPVAGQYLYTWTPLGTAAGVHADVFDVFDPAAFPRLVSFADAKDDFLHLAGSNDDALLDRMIGWASARILREYWATTGTVTERVRIDPVGFVLSTTPVAAVTAVTAVSPFAVAVAYTDAVVTNPYAGTVEFGTTVADGIYDVTYTVGGSEVPPAVTGACFALLRHWWNQFRSHGSATYGDAGFVPDFAKLPNVVQNMLRGVTRPPGIG